MKKLSPLTLIAVALVVLATTAPAWAGKQAICHFPPGNPANFHTITVSGNAVNAHVANHGDLIGSCLENCEAICDDGNVCTIDVESDPDNCLCQAEPRPQVDCDDGNQCTADACDSAYGCLNDPGPLDGSSCDDGDANTNAETCGGGFCDAPCPCYSRSDITANGAILVCGNNFGAFPALTGMRWANGGAACSGEFCAVGGNTLTCLISSPVTGTVVNFLTAQENENCRALLFSLCPNPNLTESGLTGGESTTPFIEQ